MSLGKVLAGIGIIWVLGAALALSAPLLFSNEVTVGCNTASQSNLQTALTAAKAFLVNGGGQTFHGLLTPSSTTGTSSIQQLDMGISYSPEGASSGPHEISIRLRAGDRALEMTALSRERTTATASLSSSRRFPTNCSV
jgi:hypothetical protein